MSREAHVRFCERAGLRCPARLTQIQSAPPASPVLRSSPETRRKRGLQINLQMLRF